MTPDDPVARPAPLLTVRGMGLALAAALVLGWPMLAIGGYLGFPDTASYVRSSEIFGWTTVRAAKAWLSGGDPGAVLDETRRLVGELNLSIRSIPYSLYLFITRAVVWPPGFALLQAAMTLWALFALVGPAAASRPGVLAAGFGYLAAFTSLPWFAAYLMPDLLVAVLVIHAAVLMRRFDLLAGWQQVVLTLLAAFAAVSHYGNGPLAAGLFGLVLVWRLVTRRLTVRVVAAALLPVVMAPLANLGISAVTLDTPSVAPLRLPVLLARSLQDGPARWYLEEACPEAELAFCRAFGDDVPDNITDFLWKEDGIRALTREEMTAIRAEEYAVLARAFRAYPLQQTASLVRNAALQTVRLGTDDIRISAGADDRFAPVARPAGERVLDLFDRIVPLATWAALLPLGWLLARRRLGRGEFEILAVLAAAWLLNAAIFGGLSAPVDRYQARFAWLLPAFAVLCLAARPGRSQGCGVAPVAPSDGP